MAKTDAPDTLHSRSFPTHGAGIIRCIVDANPNKQEGIEKDRKVRTDSACVVYVQKIDASKFGLLQAISKKGFWFKIEAEAKFKPQAYSSIPRI